jgi:hypothetical protein
VKVSGDEKCFWPEWNCPYQLKQGRSRLVEEDGGFFSFTVIINITTPFDHFNYVHGVVCTAFTTIAL